MEAGPLQQPIALEALVTVVEAGVYGPHAACLEGRRVPQVAKVLHPVVLVVFDVRGSYLHKVHKVLSSLIVPTFTHGRTISSAARVMGTALSSS